MSFIKIRRKQVVLYDDEYYIPYSMLCDFVNGYDEELLLDYDIIDAYEAPMDNIVEFVNEFIYDFSAWAAQEIDYERTSRWVEGEEEIELLSIKKEP